MPEPDKPPKRVRGGATTKPTATPAVGQRRPLLLHRSLIADALIDADERVHMGLPASESEPMSVVIELNLRHARAVSGAEKQLRAELATQNLSGFTARISEVYAALQLSVEQVVALVNLDVTLPPDERAIYRVWPDFPVSPLIDASVTTVKADAARRAYGAAGRGIIWAVVDSGIDASHEHFKTYGTLTGEVAELHRDFTVDPSQSPGGALTDVFGHGTHVAGIIAGGVGASSKALKAVRAMERVQDPTNPMAEQMRERHLEDPSLLAGVSPQTQLVSLKVLDDAGRGSSMTVARALEYVRKEVNGQSKFIRIAGVNLSVGYEFDAKWFACGQSPLCTEVDRLSRSGVVVVVAAGNTGYGTLSSMQRQTSVGLTMTINDPGNAELAITVGATHRDMPHTYGVSYFSSKGPTGDGRSKPDLVAPGERITSAATGRMLTAAGVTGHSTYVDDSGTSMAAPHVSGAISAFLSIRREFVGRPDDVKALFVSAATKLGRERYFEGAGLVDLMRAIQSV